MKPVILPFVIAIVVGMVVASGVTMMRAKTAPAAVVDSTRLAHADTGHVRVIDSTGAVEKAPALAMPNAPAHDSAEKTSEGSVTRAGAPPLKPLASGGKEGGVTQAGGPVALAKPAAAPTTPAELAPAERRISRVVAAMAPRDAAKVLTQLADHDVAIILNGLTEKQEAAILAQLPAERLALITKLALHGSPVVK
ncbi:hypothetical protein BH11GEM2_BH11GEM2_09780 [soil metagenome]